MNYNVPSVDQSDRRVPINLRQSGPTPVETLIDTRIRKSPYWELSMQAGCWRASVYNRMYHPRGYVPRDEGGMMAEYESLVNDVTLWNVAVERQIQVKGPDAEAFVNFVITRDATKIPPMRARYVILCNEEGGILNDPVLLRIAEDEFWFSLSDTDLMLWLQGVNVGRRFDVDIAEIDVSPVQVQGPKSVDLMVDLVGPARSTASRHESTRLTWPIPTPIAAPSRASRMAFDLTERHARQANARSESTSSDAGSPVASVHVLGSSTTMPSLIAWSTDATIIRTPRCLIHASRVASTSGKSNPVSTCSTGNGILAG